jgi:hypothetical protein
MFNYRFGVHWMNLLSVIRIKGLFKSEIGRLFPHNAKQFHYNKSLPVFKATYTFQTKKKQKDEKEIRNRLPLAPVPIFKTPILAQE